MSCTGPSWEQQNYLTAKRGEINKLAKWKNGFNIAIRVQISWYDGGFCCSFNLDT